MQILNDQAQAQLQTTDDTQTTVLSYPILQNSNNKVTLQVLANNAGNGDIADTELKFAVKRGLGSCSLVGSTTISMPLASDLSLSTSSISLVPNGSSLDIKVTGVLATTINWDCQLSVRVNY